MICIEIEILDTDGEWHLIEVEIDDQEDQLNQITEMALCWCSDNGLEYESWDYTGKSL